MAGDPYQAYRVGSLAASLSNAETALTAAFQQALPALGLDHPLTWELMGAQDRVKAARKLEGEVARDAMTVTPASKEQQA